MVPNEDATAVEEEEEVIIDPVTLKPDLFAAAAANDLVKVNEFLDRDVPPTFCDVRNDMTALHWAAIFGNANMIKVLLKKYVCHSLLYHFSSCFLVLEGCDLYWCSNS